MLDTLSGKRTYIIAILAACAVGLTVAGVIPQETLEKILTVLGIGGFVTLRAAIK